MPVTFQSTKDKSAWPLSLSLTVFPQSDFWSKTSLFPLWPGRPAFLFLAVAKT